MLNILFLVNLPLLIVITDYKPPISLYILGSLNCYHSRLIPFLYHWWQFPLRLIQFPGETGDALNWCACSTLQSSNKSALSVTSVKMGSNLIMVSALLTADMVVKMERWGKQCMFQRTPFLPQLLLCHILDRSAVNFRSSVLNFFWVIEGCGEAAQVSWGENSVPKGSSILGKWCWSVRRDGGWGRPVCNVKAVTIRL